MVSVSSTGKVTGVKAGTATITAKTSNGKSGTCVVTCKSAVPDLVLSDSNGIVSVPPTTNVKCERTLYSGWNSVCVPFALTQTMLDAFGEGCKMATIERYEIIGANRVLSVKQVESVAAGTPCLIYAPMDMICDFNLSNVSLKSAPDDSSPLKGVNKRTIIGPNYYKLTNDGQALGITKGEDAIVGPFRIYIELTEPAATRAMTKPIEIKLTQVKY